jgi:hypothetical protein
MTQACADGTQDPAADPPDPPGDCVGHVRDPQAYLPGRASMGWSAAARRPCLNADLDS